MHVGFPHRLSWWIASLSLTFILGGCSESGATQSGEAESAGSTAVTISGIPRQTDAQGKRLPFETQFKDRWSRANDGTSYEPCTALNAEQLRRAGVDPLSVEDAATVNGQTLRGCHWKAIDNQRFTIQQFVGNSESLAAEKRKNRVDDWQPDQEIDGRTVGVSGSGETACTVYLQSGGAGVNTQVVYAGWPPQPMSILCDRALSFMKATIHLVPQ